MILAADFSEFLFPRTDFNVLDINFRGDGMDFMLSFRGDGGTCMLMMIVCVLVLTWWIVERESSQV